MFKKLSSMFFNKSAEEELIEEKEEIIEEPVVEEPVVELPDEYEIPWKVAARLKNIDVAIDKAHDDLKEYFYKSKMTEKKMFQFIEELRKVFDRIEGEIREAYEIPDKDKYILELPVGTGKPAYFKKKETK